MPLAWTALNPIAASSPAALITPTSVSVRICQLAVLRGGLSAGFNGRADGADVAADERGHIGAADLNLTGEGDVGGLAHGVGRGDGRDQAFGLDQAECFAVGAAVAEVACHKRTPQA